MALVVRCCAGDRPHGEYQLLDAPALRIHDRRQLQIIIEAAHLVLSKIRLLPALRLIIIIGNRRHHRRRDRVLHLEHAGIHTIHLCDAVERTAAEYEIRHLCIIDAVIDQETDAVAFLRPESGQADDTIVIRRR